MKRLQVRINIMGEIMQKQQTSFYYSDYYIAKKFTLDEIKYIKGIGLLK